MKIHGAWNPLVRETHPNPYRVLSVMSTAAVDIITVWPTQQKLAKHLRLKFHCSKNGLKSRRKVHMQSTNPDRSVKSFPSDLEWAENSQLDWAHHDSRSSIIDFVSWLFNLTQILYGPFRRGIWQFRLKNSGLFGFDDNQKLSFLWYG